MKTDKKAMLTAAISGILLAASYAGPANSAHDGAGGECYGVNGCKGKGDCGGVKENGEKYTCSGNNECKGKGWLGITKEECDQKGGTHKPKGSWQA